MVATRDAEEAVGPESRVVFIGPCVAKKSELQRGDVADAVDCVLTFEELAKWLEQRNINLSRVRNRDSTKGRTVAQLYPCRRHDKDAGLDDDGLNLRHARVDGSRTFVRCSSRCRHGRALWSPSGAARMHQRPG